MMIQANPTKREGFSYFFRDNKRTLFLKAPRGRKYHQFKVPKNKDPIKFVEALMIASVSYKHLDYTVHYTKNNKLISNYAKADTLHLKAPRGRKWYAFELFPLDGYSPKDSVEILTDKIITRFDQLRRKKLEKKREKERKELVESEDYEEPSEVVDNEEITYYVVPDKGFYSSDKYGHNRFVNRTMIVIPEILISKSNVENILEYIEETAFDLILDQLLDMGVKDDQFFMVRLLGSGQYLRNRNGAKEMDRFGFSLERDNFNEDMWENYKERFVNTLRDKLTGRNSYLVRAGNEKLIFIGFKVEIYTKVR